MCRIYNRARSSISHCRSKVLRGLLVNYFMLGACNFYSMVMILMSVHDGIKIGFSAQELPIVFLIDL